MEMVSLLAGFYPVSFPPEKQALPLKYRYLGGLYQSIDWFSVPAELRPPYSCILANGEIVSIGTATLEKWADAKPEIVEE